MKVTELSKKVTESYQREKIQQLKPLIKLKSIAYL